MKQLSMFLTAILLMIPTVLQAAIVQQILGDYVEGELLVVPKQGAMTAVTSSGYKVLAKQEGKTNFLRMKVKSGQSMLSAMNALAAQPWVAHVEPNYIYQATAIPNDTDYGLYWGLQNTGQVVNGATGIAGKDMAINKAWDINTDCAAITVAVIDTGVDYNHPDLSANIWSNTAETLGNGIDDDVNGFIDDTRGWDFVQGDNDPMDFGEHGTHVAGTIGASGNNTIGGTGVCWNSTIMPLRALGSTGSGTSADILAAVNYAVANGAKVINMSLGGGGFSSLMNTAIANAPNVLFVIAAGNENTNNDITPSYPASYNQPNIISVAATTQTDGLASFSNYGAISVDVGAPGTNIRSTVPPARITVAGCSWDFDTATLQGWTAATFDNLGNPVVNTVAITTEAAKSASYSLTDSPLALYANNRSYRATSPACNLTGVQGAVLGYQMELSTESSWDFLKVETSPDGITWTVQNDWSGTTNGTFSPFEANMASLDGVATAQVRFRLETDGSIVFGGYHVDDIQVTVPNITLAAHTATDYAFLNGTSMATPNVAGAAALVWANEPSLTALQLKNRLLNNGDAVTALTGKTFTGKRINALMAMPLIVPTGLATQSPVGYNVPMTWGDVANDSGYVIQRKTGAALFATVGTTSENVTVFTDVANLPGTTYTYRVLAQGRDGRLSAPSATALATTLANLAPTSTAIDPITTVSGIASALSVVTVTDPDAGDVHIIAIATQGVNGTATVSGSSVSYTSNAGFVGTDTFTITATDKGGLFITGTVAVTVTAKPVVAPPPPKKGGGGCVMGVQQSGIDPLFPILIVLALSILYRRRKHL